MVPSGVHVDRVDRSGLTSGVGQWAGLGFVSHYFGLGRAELSPPDDVTPATLWRGFDFVCSGLRAPGGACGASAGKAGTRRCRPRDRTAARAVGGPELGDHPIEHLDVGSCARRAEGTVEDVAPRRLAPTSLEGRNVRDQRGRDQESPRHAVTRAWEVRGTLGGRPPDFRVSVGSETGSSHLEREALGTSLVPAVVHRRVHREGTGARRCAHDGHGIRLRLEVETFRESVDIPAVGG